jgi:hypothetical protein
LGREPSVNKSGADGGFAALLENSCRSAIDPKTAIRSEIATKDLFDALANSIRQKMFEMLDWAKAWGEIADHAWVRVVLTLTLRKVL